MLWFDQMKKGGWPKDAVCEHFLRVEVDGKTYAKCKTCDKQQANRTTWLKEDHARCSAAANSTAIVLFVSPVINQRGCQRTISEKT